MQQQNAKAFYEFWYLYLQYEICLCLVYEYFGSWARKKTPFIQSEPCHRMSVDKLGLTVTLVFAGLTRTVIFSALAKSLPVIAYTFFHTFCACVNWMRCIGSGNLSCDKCSSNFPSPWGFNNGRIVAFKWLVVTAMGPSGHATIEGSVYLNIAHILSPKPRTSVWPVSATIQAMDCRGKVIGRRNVKELRI